MEKTCPHCQHVFGRPEASEFLGQQFTESVYCSMCAEKAYVVIQTKDELKFKTSNALVSFGPILLAVVALVLSFALIFQFGAIPMLVIGMIAFGGLLFARRWMARRVYWKFSSMQKSPFIE